MTDDDRIDQLIASLPPFSAPSVVREAAAGDDELIEAILQQLERGWLGGDAEARRYTGVLLVALSADPAAMQRFADAIFFRLPTPALYRELVVMLRPAISDQTLVDWLVEAVASDDERVVGNALDLQYHAYGWPDRFRLSQAQADQLAAAVDAAAAGASETVQAALARYRPPG